MRAATAELMGHPEEESVTYAVLKGRSPAERAGRFGGRVLLLLRIVCERYSRRETAGTTPDRRVFAGSRGGERCGRSSFIIWLP